MEKGGGYGSEVLPGRRVAWIESVSRHHNKNGSPFVQCTSHQHNVRIVHPTYIYERCTLHRHLGDLQNEDEDREYIL